MRSILPVVFAAIGLAAAAPLDSAQVKPTFELGSGRRDTEYLDSRTVMESVEATFAPIDPALARRGEEGLEARGVSGVSETRLHFQYS